jgi:hypothetical protein
VLRSNIYDYRYRIKKVVGVFVCAFSLRRFNGEKLDSSPIYKIQLTNSTKHQNCNEFLKQVGCKTYYMNICNSNSIYYFEPTADLKNILMLLSLKVILKNHFMIVQQKMMGWV